MGTTRALDTAEAWDGVATGWVEHHRLVEQGKRPVTEAMLAALGLEPGHRVLEVGAGPGELATELAERVGPDGEVVATDVSPAMVAAASEALAGVPWARALVADGAHLDHVGEGYDAVVCRMGLMFVDTPADGLAEAHRVLRPGGRLAVGVWAGPEHNPWLTTVGMAAMGAGLPVELPIGPGGPFSIADAGRVGRSRPRCGVRRRGGAGRRPRVRFADAAAHVTVSSTLSPALAPVFEEATPDQRAAVLAMVADADAAARDRRWPPACPAAPWCSAAGPERRPPSYAAGSAGGGAVVAGSGTVVAGSVVVGATVVVGAAVVVVDGRFSLGRVPNDEDGGAVVAEGAWVSSVVAASSSGSASRLVRSAAREPPSAGEVVELVSLLAGGTTASGPPAAERTTTGHERDHARGGHGPDRPVASSTRAGERPLPRKRRHGGGSRGRSARPGAEQQQAGAHLGGRRSSAGIGGRHATQEGLPPRRGRRCACPASGPDGRRMTRARSRGTPAARSAPPTARGRASRRRRRG